MLPEEARPEEWYRADGSHVYDRPVVRMLRALYGHPDSGTLWEKHSFKHLQSVGSEKIPNWPSLFWHAELKVLLSVYVDDFTAAGKAAALKLCWEAVRKGLDLEDPKPMSQYLGADYTFGELVIDKIGRVRTCEISMESYF